ncbi:MAG: YicC family protein [Angelakisella sp.]|nr:YicC family protein [Angelakisella sp.]
MIRSMTGYGRAQELRNGRDITVEFRSVNHRYFEFSARVPRAYGYLEEKLKGLAQGSASRGKVEVAVLIQTVDSPDSQVAVNTALAREYVEALRGLGAELGLTDDLSLTAISRFGEIFTLKKSPDDEERIWADVSAVAQAAARFVEMRQTEGRRLREDILGRLCTIEEKVAVVEERSPQTVAEYRAKLTARMEELLGKSGVEEQRILAEAAIVADRWAVDEETVRLRSHIAQLRTILDTPEAVGRKLDFLVQEMNREANTIGSKAQDVAIAQVVVDIKSEIEKIREQIQNIE